MLNKKLNINSLNLGRMSSIQALILLEKHYKCNMLQLHELPLDVFEKRLNNAPNYCIHGLIFFIYGLDNIRR